MNDKQISDGPPRDKIANYLSRGIGGLVAIGLAGCTDDADEPEDGDETDETDENDGTDDAEDSEDIDPDASRWHREHDWEMDADGATDWDNYETTSLLQVDNLMAIDVSSDGRVWYITRGAEFETHGNETCQVGWVDPESGDNEVALELDVIVGSDTEELEGTARELGGQGIAVDPEFENNRYIYVYYHPSTENIEYVDNPYHEDITTAYQRVSRFELTDDDSQLDPDSEEVVLNIPFQLDTCCHYGGYLEFGPEGDLYISTGDDSQNVGREDGIDWFMGDEREGIVIVGEESDEIEGGQERPAPVSDAQRTAANTADLRGSILRITPTEDGSYDIPGGNLKERYEEELDEEFDDEEFLPEIYSLGFRNPYVIHADEYTGYLWVSDYANDSTSWDTNRGPMGIATHHLICEPIFGGWPYFKAFYPFRNYDYEEDEPGQPFWPDNVRNTSINNTGIEKLPDYTPPTLWHSNDWDEYLDAPAWVDMPRPGELSWPDLPASGSANAGVAYRYSDDFDDGALDPYFEGKQFFLTPFAGGGWLGYAAFNSDGSVDINHFLPDNEMIAPTDMEVLPDGRVIIMDYGEFSGEDGNINIVEYSNE